MSALRLLSLPRVLMTASCSSQRVVRSALPRACERVGHRAFARAMAGTPGEPGDAGRTTPDKSKETTHFGFQHVPVERKASMVAEVFHRVADKYDLMNDVMSGTLHRMWKDSFVRMCEPLVSVRHTHAQAREGGGQEQGFVVLDVAGGTGDIAFRIADAMRRSPFAPRVRPHIIVADINASMLEVGRARAAALGYDKPSGLSAPSLSWMEADAEVLSGVPDASVDVYTIAFGIRNVTDVPRALRTAHRVLRKGGRFMCLEFSTVPNPLVRAVYDAYSFNVIPALGEAIAGDRASYQYLVESIRRFPDTHTYTHMITDAGFSAVTATSFTMGVCAVHSGYKWD